MRLFTTILIAILVIGNIGCKQKEIPAQEIEEYISLLRSTIKEDPAEAVKLALELEEIYDQMPDLEKALFGVLFFEAHEKGNCVLPVRDYLYFSIDYYKSIKDPSLLLHAHVYNAWMYKEHNMYNEATEQALLAREYMDSIKRPNLCGAIHITLGQIAISQSEFDKAIEYFEDAIRFFKKGTSTANQSNSYMMIGRIHSQREEFDKARPYTMQALYLSPDSMTSGELLRDLGYQYYHTQNIDSALWYGRRSLTYPSYGGQIGNRTYYMGMYHAEIGNTDSAIWYAKKALERDINIYGAKDCYELLIDLAVQEGNKEEISYYLKQQRICEDSIKRMSVQPNIQLVEKLHANNKETERMRSRQTTLYSIAAIVIAIAIGATCILYRSRKKDQKQAHTYKSELDRKELQLRIKEINSEIEKLRAKYAAARRLAKPEEKEKIDKKTYTEALCLDQPEKFLKMMNKSLGLPDRLKADYPNISQKEIIWSCLYLLNLPTTDISLLMDFKMSTQYKFKQRLAKKLGFQSTKELEQMLYEKADQSCQKQKEDK